MGNKKPFNKRAFVSTGMFISAIGLPMSGLMNHYLAFDILSSERHLWMSVHNVLGVLFTIFAIWHIILNWRQLINYIKKKTQTVISREFIAAVAIVFGFLLIIILHALHK